MLTRLPTAVGLLGIGWYFAACIVGGIGGGLLLDEWLDTKPLFSLLGVFLGLAVASVGGYKLLMQVLAKSSTQGEGPKEGD